jgi:uncharacterized protein (UPF0332 family)
MMDHREFLKVASDLSVGTREGDWRSAISRAYFACYHSAHKLLSRCGFRVPQGDAAHAYIRLRLSNSGHPDVSNTGHELSQLRRDRNWADYDLGRSVLQGDAFSAELLAEKIINLLEATAVEPSLRTRITEAMKVYERDVLRQVTWQP